MRPTLQLFGLLLAGAAFGPPRLVQAQTPTLEFSSGAGNPTGNGPVTTDQIITVQNNTDNPTANTFTTYTPTTTVRFSLSNQQYTAGAFSANRGLMFGGQTNTNGNTGPNAYPLFPAMNILSNAASNNFTSTSNTPLGTGIDRDANNAVALFTDVTYLSNQQNTRYQYADLTITFNQPMVNPVLHFVGLGSNNLGAANYTTELELLTTGVTLSKLSGSAELTVNATKILNTATTPTTATNGGAASGSVLVSTSSAGISSLQLRVYLRTAAVTQIASTNSTGDGWLIGVSQLTPTAVTGYVFEDVNYGGGAGRPRTASGAAVRPGATVELYDNANNLVATTTTDASGQYTFNVPAATYTVRVVNRTVSSSRTGYTAALLPVQTYNGTTNRVGGENPAFTDAPANSGTQTLTALSTGTITPESIGTVTATGAATSGPDFGFNFDVIVNTNDTGQGSLRQFITNSNALGGEGSLAQAGFYTNQEDLVANSQAAGRAPLALPATVESSIFMIPVTSLTSGVAVITPASALPAIAGPNTAINGATQTFNIGNTNDVLLGTGGTVGTNNVALSQLNGPELQIVGNSSIAIGLNISAVNTTLRGLAIYGFGNVNSGTLNTFDNDNNANIRSSASGLVVNQSMLGSAATSFAQAATVTNASNLRITGGTSGIVVSNNLIGYANGKSIAVGGSVTNALLTDNEIRNNGFASAGLDGIDIQGNTTTVSNNLLTGTSGQGVDSYYSSGGNTIVGNTITDNGRGTSSLAPQETPGVRIYGANNNVSQNIISDNYGAGIMVQAVGTNGAATTTVISANSIFNNGNVTARNGAAATGQIGIDLQANNTNEAAGTSPFVTLNSTTTTGANGLANYPILRSAYVVGTNLVINGYAKPGAVIELFTAQPNPTGVNATGANFGQGRTFLTTFTEGVNDNDATTGQSYSGSTNGFPQGSDANANGFSFTIPLSSLPGGALAAGTLLTSTATRNGNTSEFSGNVTAVGALTGFVYEDVNYGGGAGRSRATLGAAAIGRPGAKVELYNNAGALVGTDITDASGQYSFNAPVGTGYTVRVVNNSVLSSRTGATAASGTATTGYVSNQLGVQTYNGTTPRVGGENPLLVDAAANTGAQTLGSLTSGTAVPQSIAMINVGSGTNSAGPDFGFNFDVVTNTNNAGQGSLAQFIANSNALTGENLLAQAGSNNAGTLPASVETSIFMIPAAGLTNGVATINLTTALPTITGQNTSIDGTTQTINIGNTNNVTLGIGGTVGTGNTALGQLNGPEVQLKGTQTINGITMATGTNNTTVRGLSIYGFNTNILGGVDNTGTRIEQNVIGASATSFADPTGTNRTLNEGINLNGSDNGTVTNNLIGFNGGMGIWVLAGANDNTISGNEVRSNALTTTVPNVGERLVFDGIELQGNSTRNTVSGNLITASLGHGIDAFGNDIGGNRIVGNTISNNGVGVLNNTGEEGSGLRVFGTTNPTLIANNVLTGNNGSGVLVMGTASQVTISQNSTSGNTRLGIDLLSTAETNYNSTAAGTIFWNGNIGANPNVTLNDSGDGDTGGNGLLNFPVLTSASVNGTSLVINGFARAGSLVELFLATPLTTDPTNSNRNFGQGSSYLASRTEGNGTDDSNTGTGSYSGLINGVNQGSDNTSQFTFTIPLSILTPVQLAALRSGSAVLTSTATLANSTSEFSGNLPLPADVTTALTGPATLSPGVPSGTYTATFTNEGPLTANGVTRKVMLPANATSVVLPAGASLTGNVIDFDNGALVTLASGTTSSFSFSFTPAATATGILAIISNVTTTTSQGANTAPDASTINATVAPTANVSATVTATTTSVAAGTLASAGTPPKFTVTFSNAGPATAAGVVASVQLPTGLTNVNVNGGGGSYNSTTGVVTYAGLTSIANGTPTVSVITFDAPAAGPIVASATISTTTSEAGQTANNSQTASMSIVSAFDLVSSITGPASAVAGDLVSLVVTTTNNGPSAVANAVQTVQLTPGLTNVYVSNGGVYNSATTTQNIVSNGVSYSVPAGGVVFPTLANLGSGQAVANSVSYAQPATGFAPSALVTPNTASTATTAGDSNTANNTAFLNGAASSTTLATATALAGTANAYTSIRSSAATTSVGGAVTLTVVTGNNGPAAATGVTQRVEIIPGLTSGALLVNGVTGTPSGNSIVFSGGPTYNTLTGVVTFPILADNTNGSTSGTSVTNSIVFVAPATTGGNGQLLATATVSTTNTDPVAADNVASAAVTLLQTTDLTTSINGPASATAGQAVTYTVSYLNNGPMMATGVLETAQLPAGLGTVTITDAAGTAVSGTSYNNVTGLVTFPTQTTLASGVRQVYKLSFAAPAQSFSPRSSVASSSNDGVAANNNATVSTSVTATADLATTVSGPATAVVGNPVTYSVITTNNGPVAASGTTATLQLTTGFSVTTLRVNGQTGTLNGTIINYANGDAYNTNTGLLTFAPVTSLANGASVSNYATFIMPNAANGQTTGVASASSTGSVDPTDANNTRSVATSVAPTTTTSADVTATLVITTNPTTGSVAVGTPVTFTATYGNTGPDAALNVQPTLQLSPGFGIATIQVAGQAGALSNGVITFPNGATYNTATGLVTFPTIASQASGAGASVSYAVQVTAPANGPLAATAATTTDTSEPNTATAQNNSVFNASVNVTPSFDEVTSTSGPASALPGTSQTYTVTTTNNGPSPTANAITQTVTVPTGQTPTNITNGGVYSNGTITWTIAAGQTAGSSGAVANSFTIVLPAAGFTFNATVTGDSNTGNNTASVTTAAANQPPLAFAVVNNRQSTTGNTNNPMGNTVANNPATPTGLLISPLLASDPENALNSTTPFTVLTIPTTAQGVLYYDNGGTYTAVAAGRTLSAAQATTLRFLPNTAFSGNASFTYLSTDAAGNQSPAVNYTIPVATDQASTYVKYNNTKGGSNKYVTNDVLAQTTDANAAVYTSPGTIYDPTTGVLQSGAANGLPTSGTNAVLASGTLPTGVSLDPITGRIFVSNAALLPRITAATNYTVSVTTTDINGGTNTAPVTFTIGAYPLPVELKEFTAKAMNNLDAALAWSTASEKNNDHFDVERSFNGTDYVKIGQVQGQGSKSSATDYALTDAGVARKATGTVYYRLKQVDADGTATFSPVRTVSFTAASQAPTIALFPNPATSVTQLDLSQLPAGTYQVQVLDATGRVVLSAKQEAGISQALNLNTIASGTYTVRVSGQAINLTKRLIKE